MNLITKVLKRILVAMLLIVNTTIRFVLLLAMLPISYVICIIAHLTVPLSIKELQVDKSKITKYNFKQSLMDIFPTERVTNIIIEYLCNEG